MFLGKSSSIDMELTGKLPLRCRAVRKKSDCKGIGYKMEVRMQSQTPGDTSLRQKKRGNAPQV